MKRIISVILLPFILAALFACGQSDSGTDDTTAQSGGASETAGNSATGDYGTFNSVDINGGAVTGDVLAGHKLTMINIWGTTCPYCIDEMPDLAKLNGDYAEKGFQVVGIVSDVMTTDGTVAESDAKSVQSILDTTGADYVNMVVTENVYTLFLGDVSAIPTTMFLDENGNKVGKTYLGAKSYDDWAAIIDSLLGEVS